MSKILKREMFAWKSYFPHNFPVLYDKMIPEASAVWYQLDAKVS